MVLGKICFAINTVCLVFQIILVLRATANAEKERIVRTPTIIPIIRSTLPAEFQKAVRFLCCLLFGLSWFVSLSSPLHDSS